MTGTKPRAAKLGQAHESFQLSNTKVPFTRESGHSATLKPPENPLRSCCNSVPLSDFESLADQWKAREPASNPPREIVPFFWWATIICLAIVMTRHYTDAQSGISKLFSATSAWDNRVSNFSFDARAIAVVTAIITFGSFHGFVSADQYTDAGPDREFSTAANWDTNRVPMNDPIDPTLSTISVIDGPFIVQRSIDSETARSFVIGGAILNITGGVHSDSRPGVTQTTNIGTVSAGTVNQSAGTWRIGHGLRIGTSTSSANGTYNLTGGLLDVFRGSNSSLSQPPLFLPPAVVGRPSLEVGGGCCR